MDNNAVIWLLCFKPILQCTVHWSQPRHTWPANQNGLYWCHKQKHFQSHYYSSKIEIICSNRIFQKSSKTLLLLSNMYCTWSDLGHPICNSRTANTVYLRLNLYALEISLYACIFISMDLQTWTFACAFCGLYLEPPRAIRHGSCVR